MQKRFYISLLLVFSLSILRGQNWFPFHNTEGADAKKESDIRTSQVSGGTADYLAKYASADSLGPGNVLNDAIGLKLPNGSALNPSLSFIGSTTTGIFAPASNTFAISTGGTEAMRILSDNRVNIGSTTGITGAKLYVNNTSTDITASYGSYIQNQQIHTTSGTRSGFGFYAAMNTSYNTGTGSKSLTGFYSNLQISSASNTGTWANIICFDADGGFSAAVPSGSITNLTGFNADLKNLSSVGTVGTVKGINLQSTGGIANATNIWGMYDAISNQNYFKGRLWLNDISEPTSNFFNALNITGGVTAYGNRNVSNVSSDVTTAAHIYNTTQGLEIANRTLPNLYHYSAGQGTIGAGNVLTNQIGFSALSTLTGGTNNFGYKSDLVNAATRNISTVERLSNYVKITTSSTHLLRKGMSVLVTATTNTSLNGVFVVDSIYSTTQFGYNQTGADIISTSDAGTTSQVNIWSFYSENAPNRFGGNTLFTTSALSSDKAAAPIHAYSSTTTNVEQIRLQNVGATAANRGVSIGFFPNDATQQIGGRLSNIIETTTTDAAFVFEAGVKGAISERLRINKNGILITGTADLNSNKLLRVANGTTATDGANLGQTYYFSDGTLSSTRYVNMNGNNQYYSGVGNVYFGVVDFPAKLAIKNTEGGLTSFRVDGSGGGGIAIGLSNTANNFYSGLNFFQTRYGNQTATIDSAQTTLFSPKVAVSNAPFSSANQNVWTIGTGNALERQDIYSLLANNTNADTFAITTNNPSFTVLQNTTTVDVAAYTNSIDTITLVLPTTPSFKDQRIDIYFSKMLMSQGDKVKFTCNGVTEFSIVNDVTDTLTETYEFNNVAPIISATVVYSSKRQKWRLINYMVK